MPISSKNCLYVVLENSISFHNSLLDWLAKHEIVMPEGDVVYSEPEGSHLREIRASDDKIIFGKNYVAHKSGVKIGTWSLSETSNDSGVAYLVFPSFSLDD